MTAGVLNAQKIKNKTGVLIKNTNNEKHLE